MLKNYIQIFGILNYIDFSPWIISIAITSSGCAIGVLLYFVSKSKKLPKKYNAKDYAVITSQITLAILLMTLYASFILMNGNLQIAINFAFGVVGGLIYFTFVPIISFYSILKKEKKMFLFSGIELLMFYLVLVISSNLTNIQLNFISNSSLELILIFVLFLIYFEVGLKSLTFDIMINKITQNKTYENENSLQGFNKVFNKYILFISIFVILSFLFSYILYQTNFLSDISKNLGLKIGSMESLIIFTILVLIGPLVYWAYFSNEGKSINPISYYYSTKKESINEEESKNL